MSEEMTVTIRLSEGKLREVSVVGGDVKRSILLRMSHNARHMPFSVIALTEHGLEVFQLIRNQPGNKHRISHYAKLVREDLLKNYGITFNCVIWGPPTVNLIDGKKWLCFADNPIISSNGELSQYLNDALIANDATNLDVTRLRSYSQSLFRNLAA